MTYYIADREKAGQAEIHYGQGHVRGAKAVDKACLRGLASGVEAELCVPDLQLISVDQVKDLENLHADGVIGLSPAGSEQVLSSLKATRRIQRKVFSVSLDSGVLTMGGYDFERFAASASGESSNSTVSANRHWFPLAREYPVGGSDPSASTAGRTANETHWSLPMPSMKVNDRV